MVDKVVHEARSVAGGQCSIQCFDNVDLETVVIVVECIMRCMSSAIWQQQHQPSAITAAPLPAQLELWAAVDNM